MSQSFEFFKAVQHFETWSFATAAMALVCFVIRPISCAVSLSSPHNFSCVTSLDIWNGNAAVQIQPPNRPHDRPTNVISAPTLTMEHVEVTSASGRGIVNIDGGQLDIRNCYIHDCAATGIYVGGPGSRARIERTDVIRNGNGNTTHRRGIARGHSGVYLEQGHASILDCNISQNSLTGISAVSPDNAILNLQESELVSNGSFQLEMPSIGSVAYARSTTNNNTFAGTGLPRTRSGLVAELET
jgi:Right handed beta helix region